MTDRITDLLIEFDEMGFAPTTPCPDPEKYAIEWREKVRAEIKRLENENAALRERLDKAVEIPFVFNRDIIVILYDNKEIPKLINAKVVGIGIDTEMLFEGKMDIMLYVIDTFSDTHFFHGRQYQKEWFLTDDCAAAEKQLSERGGKNE